ncbi:Homeodomain-like [Plasmopara halstedii]|uniref:Homeodomain-like n=1 Tax=Plasmopara halstedii TaxID=4781 RepID=A0A0P1A6I4_PLAHL|nr:Homeodomain-like [Plasmopara halstedii]CEG35977.1 Homeodomain-like [Plasmopara halstedii]|eukprot:XP_024572346.1 Homeodomain-like [Plasmopara halstedii]
MVKQFREQWSTVDSRLNTPIDPRVLSTRGRGKRLNEFQRSEIIAKLANQTLRVNEVWRENMASAMTYRASVGRFSQVEDKLYIWIDSMLRANLPVPPSLAIVKAKQIAKELGHLRLTLKPLVNG